MELTHEAFSDFLDRQSAIVDKAMAVAVRDVTPDHARERKRGIFMRQTIAAHRQRLACGEELDTLALSYDGALARLRCFDVKGDERLLDAHTPLLYADNPDVEGE
jgi:hypothetical protein